MSAEPRPEQGDLSQRRAERDGPPRALDAVAARVGSELWAPVLRERHRVALALLAIALVSAAHVARVGTPIARLAAGALLVAVLIGPVVAEVVVRRRARDPRRVLGAASFALGRDAVRKALAHHELAERIERSPEHEGVSPALSRLHARRALEKLDLSRLAGIGEGWANGARIVAILGIVVAIVLLAVAPARFVEGVDVGLARKGVAPIPLNWLDEVEITVRPPAYLHKHDSRYYGHGAITADRGAAIVVRGLPRRAGRTLVLADDVHEVAFLDDGSGGMVAHWSVERSGRLRVRARFGGVVIEEPTGWELNAVQDQTPRVELDGAPGTIEIAKAEGVVPLKYDAFDDHGLKEIQLVLRVGAREERRVLAKLDGEPRHDRGGYVLRTTDPLIQKARMPIGVRIEARDNDAVTGPKWGKSAEIVLVPPVIGAAEAKRHAALLAERDRLVDLLAVAIRAEAKPDADAARALAKGFDEAKQSLEDFLSSSHDGLRVPPRIALAARGRLRKASDAVAAEVKAPSAAKHAASVGELEKLVLLVDGAYRALGVRDARTVAKLLSQVAGDAADGVRELAGVVPDKQPDALGRVEVDLKALDGGGASLRALGELGRDLGEIVENDLRRVDRARKVPNLFHAELSLRDLAMRLEHPLPSFAGGQNPSAPGDPTDDDDFSEESEDESAAGDQMKEIAELAKEHGRTLGEVEDDLRDAEDPKQLEGLEEEAKRRAAKLRDAVASLPKIAGLKKTLEAAEAASREKVESMAEALEKLQLGDARERGDSAQKSLDDAKEKAWISPSAEEKLDDAAKEVDEQLKWIDDVLKKLRKAAAQKAAEKVKSKAPREKGLGQKAEEIGDKSEEHAPLPGPVRDLLDEAAQKMKDAAGKLEKGLGDEGLELQKEAQKLLEKAKQAAENAGEAQPSHGEHGDKELDPDAKVDLPKAEDHKGPDAFRKRVLDGLGSGATSPRLKDAVKKYAEGLVK